MMRSIRKRACRRGSNAIEFALTFPVFLAITFAMIEFGWYFSRLAIHNSAAMDGCREGALVDEFVADPIPVAQARMQEVLNSAGVTCSGCATATLVGAVPERTLECEVATPYAALTGAGVGYVLPSLMPTEIRSKTQSRLEWQR